MLLAVAGRARRRTRKINECNGVHGNESSGSVASTICSTEKILWRGGKGIRERERECEKDSDASREREGKSAFCRGIMRARLIVPLLMFARFRASFSSGHFSDPASPGFAWLITINKYPASARDTTHREKEITSCRGFCYNHSETGREKRPSPFPSHGGKKAHGGVAHLVEITGWPLTWFLNLA